MIIRLLSTYAMVTISFLIYSVKFNKHPIQLIVVMIATFLLLILLQMLSMIKQKLNYENAWKPVILFAFLMGVITTIPFLVIELLSAQKPSHAFEFIVIYTFCGITIGSVTASFGMILVNQFYPYD